MAGNVVDIKKIHADMMRAVETDTKRMSEGAFKTLFLSLFLDGTESHGMNLVHWIDRAGSPFHSVHITDDKDPSKILFTVPPISNRAALKDLTSRDKDGNPLANMQHVLDIYGKMSISGPQAGENYLNEQLKKRFDLMRNSPDLQENWKAWQAIFQRYGKEDLLQTKNTVEGKTQREENIQDEIEEL